jgi:plasmid stabilization system protein ParE
MARVEWALVALEDVDAICGLIARDAPSHAHMFAEDVFEAAERTALYPESGRMVPELGRPDVRELVMGNYRIIYCLHAETVTVLAVYHAARLLSNTDIERRVENRYSSQ